MCKSCTFLNCVKLPDSSSFNQVHCFFQGYRPWLYEVVIIHIYVSKANSCAHMHTNLNVNTTVPNKKKTSQILSFPIEIQIYSHVQGTRTVNRTQKKSLQCSDDFAIKSHLVPIIRAIKYIELFPCSSIDNWQHETIHVYTFYIDALFVCVFG